jgi:hypothetical protein
MSYAIVIRLGNDPEKETIRVYEDGAKEALRYFLNHANRVKNRGVTLYETGMGTWTHDTSLVFRTGNRDAWQGFGELGDRGQQLLANFLHAFYCGREPLDIEPEFVFATGSRGLHFVPIRSPGRITFTISQVNVRNDESDPHGHRGHDHEHRPH